MKIAIINGPNLNLLGKRETGFYGDKSFDQYLVELKAIFPETEIVYFQSNVEGELVNKIQELGFSCKGIILNGGAYTHTSVAMADAIAAVPASVIEVHISNIFAREDFRHVSYTGAKSKGCISGMGLKGYELALRFFIDL